jgi:hypothetical protein
MKLNVTIISLASICVRVAYGIAVAPVAYKRKFKLEKLISTCRSALQTSNLPIILGYIIWKATCSCSLREEVFLSYLKRTYYKLHWKSLAASVLVQRCCITEVIRNGLYKISILRVCLFLCNFTHPLRKEIRRHIQFLNRDMGENKIKQLDIKRTN